jgi:hypothetical protein
VGIGPPLCKKAKSWAKMDRVTPLNTYTAKGGSHRTARFVALAFLAVLLLQ